MVSIQSRFPLDFYTREASLVARDLLGAMLITEIDGIRTSGRIVETEAYLPENDAASHSSRGETSRNSAMFLQGGHSYVYFIYGMYYCFNVVTGIIGSGQAVLIRGLELVEGVDAALVRRGGNVRGFTGLADGPGKLTIAMGIGPEMNRADLTTDSSLWLEYGENIPDTSVIVTSRIGITKAQDLPLRWCVSGR